MKKMTLSDLKSRIFYNPNPIFDEELEFDEFVELSSDKSKSVKFNKKTNFLKGAKFNAVDLVFDNAIFNETLYIEYNSKIRFNNCIFDQIKIIKSRQIDLNFQNCRINSIYFEESSCSKDLIFENTDINEFKSVESDFEFLEFTSNSKRPQSIKHIHIYGKSKITSLNFKNIKIGNPSDKNVSTVCYSIIRCEVHQLIINNTTFYNSVLINNHTDIIYFNNGPKLNCLNIFGTVGTIDFKNSVKVNEININGTIKSLKISETSFINVCKFEDAEVEKFIISGGEIGLISFIKQNFQEKIIISGGEIGEIAIASNLNNVLEIRPENRMKIGMFNQFAFSQVIIKDDIFKMLTIGEIIFVNFVFPKDSSSSFSGFNICSLDFVDFYNYGNISFSNINNGLPKNGELLITNSDLGKMLFMNCDFSKYKMHFESSKITEIFLAGTTMPFSENINTFKESNELNISNKRFALTQLKKVFDNRGDSFGATKYNEAELENWLLAIPKTDLENRKLIFSQLKKMYEGRGDTVKAIEFQGKELDVHRTILSNAGGQYWERFQLSLNKYSNNFGQSWQWAIGWIVVVGLLFYILYCLSLGFRAGNSSAEDKQRFWTLASYFFEFINPIRKGEFIKLGGDDYYPISGWARVIDFFWRIVITYLGYQLIQAFRKYSKKTS
jgi:hypothetical protein